MPSAGPPSLCPGRPRLVTLSATSILARVHRDEVKPLAFGVAALSDHPPSRFDSPTGDYGTLYCARKEETAIVEALARGVPLTTSPGPGHLPPSELEGKRLSFLRLTQDALVVSLHGKDLAQLGQDTWLNKCEPGGYALTRQWAERIREWAPEAPGFEWRSRLDEDELVYVFFNDRMPKKSLVTFGPTLSLSDGPGLELSRRALLDHNIVVG